MSPDAYDELKLANLDVAQSVWISPPKIADSPMSFECRLHSSVTTGPSQVIVIGQVLCIHIADNLVKDADRCHLFTEQAGLVGRTFASGYVRTTDRFDLERPVWSNEFEI